MERDACVDPPGRRVPNQPRFAFCAAFARGLFVTSAIIGTLPVAAADRDGGGDTGNGNGGSGAVGCGAAAAGCAAEGLVAPRTGVKPAPESLLSNAM